MHGRKKINTKIILFIPKYVKRQQIELAELSFCYFQGTLGLSHKWSLTNSKTSPFPFLGLSALSFGDRGRKQLMGSRQLLGAVGVHVCNGLLGAMVL